MEELLRVLLFIRDDWAEDHHDLEIEDETGRRLAKARLPEGLEGISRLHALVAEHAPAEWAELPSEEVASRVNVGIETDRGPWVTALRAAGYQVLAINPLSSARYRERYSTSGAKSDAGDAHVLAEIVHQIGVPGDLPVMITIQPDDLRQNVRITRVAFGAGGGVPLPISRRGQRVDRQHLVAGRPQRRHPRAAVGLDPDEHPTRDFLAWQFRPFRRSVLGDQCV